MRILAVIVLFAYLTNLGCTSMREVPPSDVDSPNDRVFAAKYTSGETVEFDKVVEKVAPEENNRTRRINNTRSIRYAYLDPEAQTIDGAVRGQPVSIPVSELQTVRVERFSTEKFALWTLVGVGVVVGISVIALALSEPSFF